MHYLTKFVLVLSILPVCALAAPAPAPTVGTPGLDAKTQKRIERREEYYARVYSRLLKSRDWFVRSVAISALSSIQAEPTTEALISAMETETHVVAQMMLWEALHARQASLTDDQWKTWVETGLTWASRGRMPGDFRAGLVGALASRPPTTFKNADRVLLEMVRNASPVEPADAVTLTAIRKLVAAWRDRAFSLKLSALLDKSPTANCAEYVLGGLNGQIERIGSIVNAPSSREWQGKCAEWAQWIRKNLQDFDGHALPAYTGRSEFLAAPQVIRDPDDPQWMEDLELKKLHVSHFDVVFAIDSTGSMAPVMAWVARDVVQMLKALHAVAREPRIGVVLFRHEIDPKAMKDCCKGKKIVAGGTSDSPSDYAAKIFRLTGRAKKLSKDLSQEKAGSGHHRAQGANYGGMLAALLHQPWTKSPSARKVVVLMGDANSTDGSVPLAEKMITDAHADGWQFHAVKVKKRFPVGPVNPRILPEFHQYAEWGGGQCFAAGFAPTEDPSKNAGNAAPAIVRPLDSRSGARHCILSEIISGSIPPQYHKRVDPVVVVLLGCMDSL